MHVTLVNVYVKVECIAAFLEQTRKNHLASVQEPGNLRFDVLQDPCAADRFTLYEAYQSEQDAAAHKQTSHYLAWRDAVADMMAQPREGINYIGLLPEQFS